MARLNSEFAEGKPLAHELEPYRRLIELQKEIIRLAQQNERAQQECVALRAKVATKASSQKGTQRTVRQKVNQAIGQLPGFPAKSQLLSLIIKGQPTC